MGYYLVDNGGHYYAQRQKKIKGIVIHITAGLEDLDLKGADLSAEKTARYFATTDRKASAHAVVDSDTIIDLLPDKAVAFHCINYNGATLGLEICKTDVTWSDEPKDWVERTLKNAAKWCSSRVAKYDIPILLCSKNEVDVRLSSGKMFGFTYHSRLDPSRRRDPGEDFPWGQFVSYLVDSSGDKDSHINKPAEGSKKMAVLLIPENQQKGEPLYFLGEDGSLNPVTFPQHIQLMQEAGFIKDRKVVTREVYENLRTINRQEESGRI